MYSKIHKKEKDKKEKDKIEKNKKEKDKIDKKEKKTKTNIKHQSSLKTSLHKHIKSIMARTKHTKNKNKNIKPHHVHKLDSATYFKSKSLRDRTYIDIVTRMLERIIQDNKLGNIETLETMDYYFTFKLMFEDADLKDGLRDIKGLDIPSQNMIKTHLFLIKEFSPT